MTDRSAQSAEESWRELRLLVERQSGASEGWEERLEEFLQLLRARNEVVNLVSRASIDRIVELQVLPSLAGLLVLPPDEFIRVLDIGSGGGFPGIPLKILRPKIRLDLVEGTQKKARFLAECVQTLELDNALVHACRVESPTDELLERAPFDLAFARSLGQEVVLSRSAKTLLGVGCPLWVFSPGAEGAEEYHPWTGMDGRRITGLRRLATGGRVSTRLGEARH